MGFTWFYWLTMDYTIFLWVSKGYTWFCWVTISCAGFYWVLQGYNGLNCAFYGLVLGYTCFYRDLSGFIRF